MFHRVLLLFHAFLPCIVDDQNDTRILGISTTNSNDKVAPRKSTSEEALTHALDYAKNVFGAESRTLQRSIP